MKVNALFKTHLCTIKFLLFLIIGGINTINTMLFSWIYHLYIGKQISFILGYTTSLIIAYLLNSWIIFKQPLGIKKAVKFALSYIPNFIIQMIIVWIGFYFIPNNTFFIYASAAIIGIPITFLIIKLFAFNSK